jgi:hypothetical protein
VLNSPILIKQFNHLHCGERGLFIPLALGQVFLNCPPPTHLQLTYSRFRGKITRCEVYKSDFLTVRGVQIDILTYSRFTCTAIPDEGLRVLRVIFEGSRLRSCASEWSVATFGHPKVVFSKLRRSWSMGLRFRMVNHHAWPPEGAILYSLRLPEDAHLRCFAGTFVSEGGLLAPWCLDWQRAPFGHSCYPTPWPCRRVRRCF